MRVRSGIKKIMADRYPDALAGGLTFVGAGLDFCAFKTTHAAWGPIVVKAPRHSLVREGNGLCQGALELLRQEAFLLQYFKKFDLPVARFRALLEPSDPSHPPLLLCDYVDTDGTIGNSEAIGATLDQLHRIPAPDYPLVAQEGLNWQTLIPRRIRRRLSAINRILELSLPLPDEAGLAGSLWEMPGTAQKSILHMDMRHENLRWQDGRIRALLDWGNAIIGHPVLEIARLRSYGYMDRKLLEVYPRHYSELECPKVVDLVCALDTSTMLSLVFLEEAPDRAMAKEWIGRTEFLLHQILEIL